MRRSSYVCLLAALAATTAGNLSRAVYGQLPDPTRVFANAYHVTAINGDNASVPDSQAGALMTVTNGIIDHGTGNGQVDGFDTWQADDFGVATDFVGLGYDAPVTLDWVTVELGNQFVDGGDWEEEPKVYLLKNPVMNSDSVRPEISPNWVEIPASLFALDGEDLHEFDDFVIPGAGGTIRMALEGTVEERTAWGWAVGGVDGNQTDSTLFNFISVTELYAEGSPGVAPVITPPATPQPMNLVSNAYHSVNHSDEDFSAGELRGDAFQAITNGVIENDGPGDGFDTFQADSEGVITDFVGLQYNSLVEFDTINIELGHQFGDGGDWEEMPNIYVLKNPVDTDHTAPEDDPNWVQVEAIETTGHEFEELVLPGEGASLSFQLTGPATERTGWGWAVGGVDGNHREDGIQNFISITEVSATGTVVSSAVVEGDFDGNGVLDANDLDLLAVQQAAFSPDEAYDLTGEGNVDADDRTVWLHDLKGTWYGDADLNGEFDSSDFVTVFTAGKYESGEAAGWAEGDWDGDGIFGSSDFVTAFADGGYENGPRAASQAVPEPATGVLWLIGFAAVAGQRRFRRNA